MSYVELHARSAFSFLRGGSSPEAVAAEEGKEAAEPVPEAEVEEKVEEKEAVAERGVVAQHKFNKPASPQLKTLACPPDH